jgi:NAD(P)H-flavin reductase
MSPGQTFPYHFSRRDERGELQLGRRYGLDLGGNGDQPILRVDGPHAAPAEHYVNYKTVMIVGAGIGMTPCASVLTAMLKYRWRFGQPPEKLHFYWVVQHGEVDAFQWFLHLIAELEHEHFKQRANASSEDARRDWNRCVVVFGTCFEI